MSSRIAYQITDEYALVRRPKSPFLYLEWREEGRPVRRSTGCSDIEQAKQRARDIILETAAIRQAPADASRIIDILDRYFLTYARKLASASTYKASFKLWGAFYGDDVVTDLKPGRQRAFKKWLEARGLSAGYVRRVIGDGKAALNYAWEEQEIDRVPFIKLPPVAGGYPHFARHAQLVAFLNAPMPDYLFAYCMIRLNTGSRGDAARDLQPFMIDRGAGLITLNPPGRQQTKKFRPIVPITEFLAAFIDRQPASAYLVNYQGRRLKGVRRAWHNARVAAGLPKWFTPRVLRHTVGTELRRRGVPGWDLSGQFGHKKGESAPMTENYAKFDPAYLASAKAAFDAWMRELAAEVPRMRGAAAGRPAAGKPSVVIPLR